MRLLDVETLELTEFFDSDIPKYAILSHRWEDEEVTYQDFNAGRGPSMKGWRKVDGCRDRAKDDGWKYVWIDSCCIDKSSSAELSEAINSMFLWYTNAQVCYAYLSDVPNASSNPHHPSSEFCQSKWFERGWTLQELLAPRYVEFYDRSWIEIGTKSSLRDLLTTITGVEDFDNFKTASVAQKMSWASCRTTKRVEDEAYCLLGLFDVNMPPLYGEGQKAFQRLQLEILNTTDDESIFAWEIESTTVQRYTGFLAPSPKCFSGCGSIVIASFDKNRTPHRMTNKGILVDWCVTPHTYTDLSGQIQQHMIAPLNCIDVSETVEHVAIILKLNQPSYERYFRPAWIPRAELQPAESFERRMTYLKPWHIELKHLIMLHRNITIHLPTVSQLGLYSLRRIYFKLDGERLDTQHLTPEGDIEVTYMLGFIIHLSFSDRTAGAESSFGTFGLKIKGVAFGDPELEMALTRGQTPSTSDLSLSAALEEIIQPMSNRISLKLKDGRYVAASWKDIGGSGHRKQVIISIHEGPRWSELEVQEAQIWPHKLTREESSPMQSTSQSAIAFTE